MFRRSSDKALDYHCARPSPKGGRAADPHVHVRLCVGRAIASAAGPGPGLCRTTVIHAELKSEHVTIEHT
jgi:hypothetical protein